MKKNASWKVPREFIFGKLMSFHLSCKDFQEKSKKIICPGNQTENQTKLSLQKILKNVKKFTIYKEESLSIQV